MHPVMREFYKERNVVIEERRMRTDSNPIGRLLEQFTTAAFQAHPYHRPTIGWMADLNSFSATDAQHFFDEYYIPSNMVVAVVGDVKASEAMPIIEKYFGRIPSREQPDERTTTEPPQNSERRVVLYDRSQPLYLEGYHRPDYRNPDDAVYDAIADLMSERAHFASLSRPGARQKDRGLLRRLHRFARATSIPICSRSMPSRCPATRPKKWRTRFTPKSIA